MADRKSAKSALPEGWQLVSEEPGQMTAEKYVQSLGLQKVTEVGVDMAALTAACEAYDQHLARVAEGLAQQSA